MKLVEYQGKELFKENGIPVPKGRIAATTTEAGAIASEIGGKAVLKAQVPVGGRGKAGGIKIAENQEEARILAGELLGMDLKGFEVEKLLVEEFLNIERELYLSLIVDSNSGKIILLFSLAGGMDIEEVAEKEPEKLFRLEIDPISPPPMYQFRLFLRRAGFQGDLLQKLTVTAHALLTLFLEKDLLVAEINPLAVLDDGRLVAGDAKVEVDDNALFRQKFEITFFDDVDELETKARSIGVTYVKLSGDIGVIASGAGLAMATMDILKEQGHSPANFMETGGGITEELMYNAVKLVCSREDIKGVIINLYGGVNPIEKGAAGAVRALREIENPPPMVAKALGNKQEECWQVFKEGGVTVVPSPRTEEAVGALIERINNRAETMPPQQKEGL